MCSLSVYPSKSGKNHRLGSVATRERGKRRIHQRPGRSEIEACRPWLVAEIDAVEPEVIICCGSTAAQSLLGWDFRVTACNTPYRLGERCQVCEVVRLSARCSGHTHRREWPRLRIRRFPLGLAFTQPGVAGLLTVIVVEGLLIACMGIFNPVNATERLERTSADHAAQVLTTWSASSKLAQATLMTV